MSVQDVQYVQYVLTSASHGFIVGDTIACAHDTRERDQKYELFKKITDRYFAVVASSKEATTVNHQ